MNYEKINNIRSLMNIDYIDEDVDLFSSGTIDSMGFMILIEELSVQYNYYFDFNFLNSGSPITINSIAGALFEK